MDVLFITVNECEKERIEKVVRQREKTQVKRRGKEVVNALKRMKRNKADGPEDVPVEAWRGIGRAGIVSLKATFGQTMETE